MVREDSSGRCYADVRRNLLPLMPVSTLRAPRAAEIHPSAAPLTPPDCLRTSVRRKYFR